MKIRIVINQGSDGIALKELAAITEHVESFVRNLAKDIGIASSPSDWVAKNFQNGSFICSVHMGQEHESEKTTKFKEAFAYIQTCDISEDVVDIPGVSNDTIVSYTEISGSMGPKSNLSLGIAENDESDEEIQTTLLDRVKCIKISEYMNRDVIEYDSIVGSMHSLHKAGNYFKVRDFARDDLVKCTYKSDQYQMVINCLQDRSEVVEVSGIMKTKMCSRGTPEMKIKSIEKVDRYQNGDFAKLLGSMPDLVVESDLAG
jgi:hypothetical protein